MSHTVVPGGWRSENPVTCRTRGVGSREVVVSCRKCWDHPKKSSPFPVCGAFIRAKERPAMTRALADTLACGARCCPVAMPHQQPLAHLCSSSRASLLSLCPLRPSLSPSVQPLFAFLTACPSPHSPPCAHCIFLFFSVLSAQACTLSPKQEMLAVASGSPGSTSHPPVCPQDISTPRAQHPEPPDLLAPSLASNWGANCGRLEVAGDAGTLMWPS